MAADGKGPALQVDVESSLEHFGKLYQSWKSHREDWQNADAIVFTDGSSNEDVATRVSNAHEWLFGYELTETIIALCAHEIVILTSGKKVDLLQDVAKKGGPVPIKLLTKKPKAPENKDAFKQIMESIKKSNGGKIVGTFVKDKLKGEFSTMWLAELRGACSEVDIAPAFSDLLAVKDAKELKTVKASAAIAAHVMKMHLVSRIETVIDEGEKITHKKLSEECEALFENPRKISAKLQPEQVESAYTPMIQSGGKYDLKLGTEPTADNLHFGTIVCSLGAKYKSYCTNVARTYFVDPKKEHEEIYALLLDVEAEVIKSLRPGAALKDIYETAIGLVRERKPALVGNFTKTAGAGIGLELQERAYQIGPQCERKVKANMVFSVTVGFTNLRAVEPVTDKAKETYAMLLSDTVVVRDGAEPEVQTDKCLKSWTDISYYLEEEKEQKPKEKKDKKRPAEGASDQESEPEDKPKPKRAKVEEAKVAKVIAESASRRSAQQRAEDKQKMQEADEKRRSHQKELEEKKRQEAMLRFSKKKERKVEEKQSVAQSYADPSEFPKDIKNNKIYVDSARESILVPIYGVMVPFHVSGIKNASKLEDDLRINFSVPTAATVTKDGDQRKVFIKEITYRCSDPRNLNNALRMIKELRKRITNREAEQREKKDLVVQEKLIISRAQRNPQLRDVFIRPKLAGRGNTTGTLEAHTNGFRFSSNKQGGSIDVLYKNIKHAFFQPAEGELLVLIHLHLHHAIMVGKKKSYDLQFCTEVMEVSQDLGKGGRYDDDFEEEQRERALRTRLNNEFKNFCEKVESQAEGLEFDIPYRELGFNGVPYRSDVFLQPTVNCLVNLIEQPFFVLTLEDIEIAVFERIQFGLKNFDIVFVLKDYEKPPIHVNNIQVQYLDPIKEWLDSCDIKYYESPQNLQWNMVMKEILKDPKKFHTEDGGWSFLNAESDAESEDEDGEDTDAFSSPSESESSDDDDEYDSGSDLAEEEESDEDASGSGDESEESEDWDELERKAEREDKERARKRREKGEAYDSEDERRDAAKSKQRRK